MDDSCFNPHMLAIDMLSNKTNVTKENQGKFMTRTRFYLVQYNTQNAFVGQLTVKKSNV